MKVNHLLFDLDNTLYPSSSAMDKGITTRMLECVADFFNCSIEKAIEIRKERIVHFSTTLEWLRSEGMNDIEGFLAHVHPENEADELTEQPGLREFLISLDYPKSILTNAPKEHSMRVLKKLGIEPLRVGWSTMNPSCWWHKVSVYGLSPQRCCLIYTSMKSASPSYTSAPILKFGDFAPAHSI